MKRMLAITIVFAAFACLTVAAQADGKGEDVYKQNCLMCHAVNGKGGVIGPELTKVGNTVSETKIREKLEKPKKSNPNTAMPSFKSLPRQEFEALVEYLKSLK